jgi:hypothetical protein
MLAGMGSQVRLTKPLEEPPPGPAPHPLTHAFSALREARDEGLHSRGLWEARAVHGPARAVPRGVHGYSTGTAQEVLDHAPPGARLVFSCRWHITRDGQDVYSWKLKALVNVGGRLVRLARVFDIDDQVEACRRVFASDTRWTVVRGSDLEEGESQGLPVWSRHVGDPILESNLTRRVDFALFMVEALENDELIQRGPGDRRPPDALSTRARRQRLKSSRKGRARAGAPR